MGGLFGGGKKAPPPPPPPPIPEPKPPAPMPDVDAPQVISAKRKRLTEAAASSGRRSTILTAPSQGAGSPLGASGGFSSSASDYASKTLGG